MERIIRAGPAVRAPRRHRGGGARRARRRAVQARADRAEGRHGDGHASDDGESSRSAAASSRSTTTSTATARPSGRTSAAARTCRTRGMIGNGCAAHPHRRGLLARLARRTRSCSASTAPRGRPRTSCARTSSASRRPPSATTASSARELDLFSFPEEIGSGLVGLAPARAASSARRWSSTRRRRHIEAGYTYVYTPHITKGDLFVTVQPPRHVQGGHVPARSHLDEERDEDGNVTKQGVGLLPQADELPDAHPDLPSERARSYRDLPMRLAENGTVYRNELSRRAARASPACAASPRTTRTSSSPPSSSRTEITKRARLRPLDAARLRSRATSSSSSRCATTRRTSGSAPTRSGTTRPNALRQVAHRQRAEAHRGAGRGRVLRPEDRPQGQGRDRPHLAALDRAARLQPARAVRAGVHRPRRSARSARS